jgi:hypothetical protein
VDVPLASVIEITEGDSTVDGDGDSDASDGSDEGMEG